VHALEDVGAGDKKFMPIPVARFTQLQQLQSSIDALTS
jgi:hypothetical protein